MIRTSARSSAILLRPEDSAAILAKVRHRSFRQIDHSLVDVAPGPALVGFIGSDNGVRLAVGVMPCMLPRGVVAAPDVAASQAEPQMNPIAAGAQAFFAALWRACGHGLKSFFVFADHVSTPQDIIAKKTDGSACRTKLLVTHANGSRPLCRHGC